MQVGVAGKHLTAAGALARCELGLVGQGGVDGRHVGSSMWGRDVEPARGDSVSAVLPKRGDSSLEHEPYRWRVLLTSVGDPADEEVMPGFLQWFFAEGDRSPAHTRERVTARPGFAELVTVGSIVIILIASMGYPGHGIDWEIFDGAADGSMFSDRGLGYYYPYWLLPLFDFYGLAGTAVGGLLWALTNVAGVSFAARVFGARPFVVLVGFGAVSSFYTGTITGVALGALAGCWWAVHEQRWEVVGGLSLLAVAKPQWGVPILAVIVLQARPPLIAWARMAIVPLPVVIASLAAYGWWPGEVLDRAAANPPEGNGSLWAVLGPVVLILWLPLLLPMEARRRLALVAATAMLAVPYVQQYDFTVLWVMTGDGLALLSHLDGPLISLLGEDTTRAVQTIWPLTAWVVLVREPARGAWQRRTGAGVGLPTGEGPQPA